jgi:hypothetical protein
VSDARFPKTYREYKYDGLDRVLSVVRRNADNSRVTLLRKVYNDAARTVLSTDAKGIPGPDAVRRLLPAHGQVYLPPGRDSRTADYNGSGRSELSHTALCVRPRADRSAPFADELPVRGGRDPITYAVHIRYPGANDRVDRTRSVTTIPVSVITYTDTTNEVVTKTYRSASGYVSRLWTRTGWAVPKRRAFGPEQTRRELGSTPSMPTTKADALSPGPCPAGKSTGMPIPAPAGSVP